MRRRRLPPVVPSSAQPDRCTRCSRRSPAPASCTHQRGQRPFTATQPLGNGQHEPAAGSPPHHADSLGALGRCRPTVGERVVDLRFIGSDAWALSSFGTWNTCSLRPPLPQLVVRRTTKRRTYSVTVAPSLLLRFFCGRRHAIAGRVRTCGFLATGIISSTSLSS